MDFGNWDDAIEDDSEEGAFKKDQWKGRDHLIFMIDCSKYMMTKLEDEGTTCFANCLKVVADLYRLRCMTCDKDLLGVLLYNTDASKNTHNFEHIYALNELALPNAGHVKQMEALYANDGRKFQKELGHGEAKLDEAFWMAGTMFSTQAVKEGTKRVILLTNCDKPHRNDLDLQKRVIQKMKDLRDQGIGVDIIPVADGNFDWSFYQLALEKPAAECAEAAAVGYEELHHRMVCKSYKRRAMATLAFQLGPGLELGIGLYNLYSIARVPTASTLYKHTNEPVTSVQTYVDADTGDRVLQVEMKKTQTYGGKKIALEKEEVDQLKMNIAREPDTTGLGLPVRSAGLVLLGFKPLSYLKPHHFVQPGLFAYPDERSIAGSSKLFRALLEKCAARETMAICRLIARANMAPKLIALLPQLEQYDETGFQSSPSGFIVVYLPYADDIRDLRKVTEQRTRGNVSEEQVEKAVAVIRKLKTDGFNPESFPNPALQKHYRAVEAIALDRETVEEVNDVTEPDLEAMEKKAKDEMDAFINAVFSDHYVAGGKKKTATGGDRASKKPKVEGLNLEEEARANRLQKITVPMLRELSNQNGIKLAGTRKADIIDQINRYFGI